MGLTQTHMPDGTPVVTAVLQQNAGLALHADGSVGVYLVNDNGVLLKGPPIAVLRLDDAPGGGAKLAARLAQLHEKAARLGLPPQSGEGA